MAAFKVTGIREIDRKLAQLEPRLARKYMKRCMRTGMKHVQREAKSLAPRRSGNLQKQIKVRAGKRSRRSFTILVQTAAGDYKGDAFYASMVNWGHFVGSRKLGADRAYVKGTEFFERAYKNAGGRAKDITMEELRRGIDELAKGGR